MLKMNVCRVCLGSNMDLYCVTNPNYREMYEKLTNTKLEDGLPESMCYICHSQLRKCMKFIKTAMKSYKLLLQWSRCGTVITKSTLASIESPYKYDSTPVEVLSIDSETGSTEEVDVKKEVNNTKEVTDNIQKPKSTKESLHNNHSLFWNYTSLNIKSVTEETSSLLRNLLITNDKSLNDRVANDNSLNDRVANDNSLNDKFANDKSLNDRVPNGNSLNEIPISNDNSSLLRHLLISNDKSTNDRITNDIFNTIDKSSLLNNSIFLSNKTMNEYKPDDDLMLKNDDFSSSDDEFLSSYKPIQTKGQFLKDQYKKLNVTVVKMDIERQRQDISSRLHSDNYLHSEYKCDYCYRGFTTSNTFIKHMYKHSEEKSGKYECDICHYRYRIISQLRIHIENSHSRFYKCNVCGTMLHSLFEAKIHNNEHKGFRYACKLCSKDFKKRTSYFSHVRIKHSSKHICKLCGKGFVSGIGLLQHGAKIHRGEITRLEPGAECYECDLKFVSMAALYRHRLDSPRHTADSLHSTICFVCHHDMKNEILLKKHLKEHRDILFYKRDKPVRETGEEIVKEAKTAVWKCDECSKVFNQKGNMRTHIKKQHLNIKMNYVKENVEDFICEICGVKRRSKAALVCHRRRHTGERPYPCPSCPKRFRERGQLTLHVRTHTGHRPYSCAHCDKLFAQKSALNRHMRTHTGAKPYTCQLCLKQFSQTNSLKGHVATVHFKLPSYTQRKREKQKMTEKLLLN